VWRCDCLWEWKHTCTTPSHCTCPLTTDERRVSYWANEGCCRYHGTNVENDTTELLKTLIFHNEMDVLLRISSHPLVHQEYRFSLLGVHNDDKEYGWAEIMRTTLEAYITLNVFYLKPETHDPQRKSAQGRDWIDYRRTSSYQKMLIHCTRECAFNTYTCPHRKFFGVPQGMYRNYPPWCPGKRLLYGCVTLQALRKNGMKTYLPTLSDIPVVVNYLGVKGLPPELALTILEFAEYVPYGKLDIADDPLHPENEMELRRYLSYYWQLLVRCDMLAKAGGKRISWINEVKEVIWQLWGEDFPKMVKFRYGEPENAWEESDIQEPYRRFDFI
jgi:hypothetical protein